MSEMFLRVQSKQYNYLSSELLGGIAVRVTSNGPDFVLWVGQQALDDGAALGASSTKDNDEGHVLLCLVCFVC